MTQVMRLNSNRLHFIRQMVNGLYDSGSVCLVDRVIRPFLGVSPGRELGRLPYIKSTDDVWLPSPVWKRHFQNHGFTWSGTILSYSNSDEFHLSMDDVNIVFVDFFDDNGWQLKSVNVDLYKQMMRSRPQGCPLCGGYHFPYTRPRLPPPRFLLMFDMQFEDIAQRKERERRGRRETLHQLELMIFKLTFTPRGAPLPQSPVPLKRNYSPRLQSPSSPKKPPKKGRRGKLKIR